MTQRTPRKSFRRIAAILVALGLAPGTWWRSSLPPPEFQDRLTITELDVRSGYSGELELTGAWHLEHPNPFFGGFSALLWLGGNRLRAGSDRSLTLDFTLPEQPSRIAVMRPAPLGPGVRGTDDLEAMARDPQRGTQWLVFESGNFIERQDPDGTVHRVQPLQMANWPYNGGGESLARLRDGRFLLLGENLLSPSDRTRPALLFPGDPVENPEPVVFGFLAPRGYRPVDAAELPGGQVMILLRRIERRWPPRFASALMVADPAKIMAGGVWRGEIVARVEAHGLAENYEGLAVIPRGEGAAADLYLISDNNFSPFQRTVLLRFAWAAPE